MKKLRFARKKFVRGRIRCVREASESRGQEWGSTSTGAGDQPTWGRPMPPRTTRSDLEALEALEEDLTYMR